MDFFGWERTVDFLGWGRGSIFFGRGEFLGGQGCRFFYREGRPFSPPPFSQSVVCFHFVLFQSSVIDDTD